MKVENYKREKTITKDALRSETMRFSQLFRASLVNGNKFDERQLAIRKDAFTHILFGFSALFIFDLVLNECGVIWGEGWISRFLLLLIPFTLGCVELLWRGVYLPKFKLQGVILIACGVINVITLTATLIRVAAGTAHFIVNGILSANGASILVMVCGIALFTAWVVRIYVDKNRENTEIRRASQEDE